MMDAVPTDFVPLAEQPYETTIHLADDTYVKSYRVPRAHTILPQHSHSYSHTSYIATGAVKVWREGEFVREVHAPDGILIEAHALHLFETLADNTTLLCIHSIAAGEEPDVDEHHVVAMPNQPAPPRPERLSMDGFTFQVEDIDQWFADAPDLFRAHMAVTGQADDAWTRKNLPLGRQMDAVGAMQIMTARSSNGALQGYVMSIIGPSLDDPGAVVAQQMTQFAAPTCPGLGRKLQQSSIAALKARGVTEVLGRAGIRGSGPRMGALYRRLGFADAGQLYRLEM